MIRLLDENKIKSITSNPQSPHLTVRIFALLAAYGTNQRFFEVWEHNNSCLIARLDNSFYVYAPQGADYEELAAFLCATDGALTVSGQADCCRKIADFVNNACNITYSNIVAKPNAENYNKSSVEIDSSPKLDTVYQVLKSCENSGFTVGDFNSWYVDISHRIRHGCGEAYLISCGKAAACCLITAQSDFAGLISGVAVIPQFRAKGFAAALVSNACEVLCQRGRIPVLECSDELLPFYEKMGFSAVDRGAEIRIER